MVRAQLGQEGVCVEEVWEDDSATCQWLHSPANVGEARAATARRNLQVQQHRVQASARRPERCHGLVVVRLILLTLAVANHLQRKAAASDRARISARRGVGGSQHSRLEPPPSRYPHLPAFARSGACSVHSIHLRAKPPTTMPCACLPAAPRHWRGRSSSRRAASQARARPAGRCGTRRRRSRTSAKCGACVPPLSALQQD